MPEGPHTVLFFLDDKPIGRLPRTHFTDPYFPVGNEVITLSGKQYRVEKLREVMKPQPGEVCVNVKETE